MLLGLLSKRNPNWATCQLPSPTSLLASSLSPEDYPSPVPLYLQLLQPCLTHSRCPRDGNRTHKWTLTNCSGGVLAFVWFFSPQVHCTFHTRCVPQKLCVSWIFTGRNLFKMINAVLCLRLPTSGECFAVTPNICFVNLVLAALPFFREICVYSKGCV